MRAESDGHPMPTANPCAVLLRHEYSTPSERMLWSMLKLGLAACWTTVTLAHAQADKERSNKLFSSGL